MELTGKGFDETDLNNNSAAASWSAGDLPVYPDPFIADLKISAIQAESSETLAVIIQNGGPDLIENLDAALSCQVVGIARSDGTSAALPDLDLSARVTLDAGAVYRFKPSAADLDFNLQTHWYQVACQVKTSTGFMDPNQANNFLTQVVY